MEIGPQIGNARRDEATRRRQEAAELQKRTFITDHPDNGDEQRYANRNYIGSYTKGLPHDDIGEVNSDAYLKLRRALESGRPDEFNKITLGCNLQGRNQGKLVSPQAAYAYSFEGQDSHGLTMPPPPSLESAQTASEMAECYWQALTRDVPFSRYEADSLTQEAAESLSRYSAFKGPKENGRVTTRTLFRVNTPGDLAGPFISQFLVQPFVLGALEVEQRYRTTVEKVDYMTDFGEYLNIRKGCAPATSAEFEEEPRYIYSGRSLGEYIHFDPPLSHFFYAASILLNYAPQFPDLFDPGNPYINNPTQQGFVTFATGRLSADFTDICTRVALEALKAAWFQKWLVHRRLRPEVYAAWIDNIKSGRAGNRSYPINPEILNDNELLERVFVHNKNQNLDFQRTQNGSYLLPMAYPEGCPLHPAYPSGHATYGGAGVTVLKAIFNENFKISRLFQPKMANDNGTDLVDYNGIVRDELTVGGELNKLASNVGYARDFTGVHWRTDGEEGQLLGERVAIAFLQDRVKTYHEDFPGYTLTKFDGQRIRIMKDRIENLY